MRAPPFLLLACVLLLPGAAACSWAYPAPLEGLAWHPGAGLVGGVGHFWSGPVDLEEGVARAAWPSDALLSPDGRFVVFPRAGPDVQTGPAVMVDTCGFHLPRHLVAYDRERDAFALVARGPLWGFGATADGVLAFDGREARLLAWGTWEPLRAERAPGVGEPLQYRAPTLSPDGSLYVAWEEGALRRLDGALVADLDAGAYRLAGVAFSPDGAHVAAHLEHDAARGELRIVRLADGAVVASEPLAGAHRALHWGAGGLAWIETAYEGSDGTLHLRPDAPALDEKRERDVGRARSAPAWSPDGARLAVVVPVDDASARIVLLDARLATVSEHDVRVEPARPEAWARLEKEVPVPSYTLAERVGEQARGVPAPAAALVALALAGLALARRR